MEKEQRKEKVKNFLKGFAPYCVNFFAAMGIGLVVVIAITIPMRFFKIMDDDLWSFIVHLLVMCGSLWGRSYRQGYHQNPNLYTFSFRRATSYTAAIFVVQILLVVLFGVRNGGHAVYIAGPSRWISLYLLTRLTSSASNQYALYCQLNWSLMLLIDILVYAPIIILGEWFGAKRNQSEGQR